MTQGSNPDLPGFALQAGSSLLEPPGNYIHHLFMAKRLRFLIRIDIKVLQGSLNQNIEQVIVFGGTEKTSIKNKSEKHQCIELPPSVS